MPTSTTRVPPALQVRSDLDTLLLPLLELLYSAHQRTANQLYMLLIILLMLSQDSAFAQNVHRITLQVRVRDRGKWCLCADSGDPFSAARHWADCNQPESVRGLPCSEWFLGQVYRLSSSHQERWGLLPPTLPPSSSIDNLRGSQTAYIPYHASSLSPFLPPKGSMMRTDHALLAGGPSPAYRFISGCPSLLLLLLQSVPFYRERSMMRTSLGSLLVVLLLRTAHYNLAKLRDVYLHTNTLAALANLAPHMSGMME